MRILFFLSFPIALLGAVQLGFALLSVFLYDNVTQDFLNPALAMLAVASVLFLFNRKQNLEKTNSRDALVFAAGTWFVMGVLGAFPIASVTGISFADSVFESISGLTTTGATMISGLDELPPTFLMYRQFLQWLGGLGVVIFVVAVLPWLNIGGMKLLKAETPGPIKDEKVAPRIAKTAHYLWFVYISLTVLCAIAYYAAGMTFYDAVAHSLTTISTGGFSTHDASMGFFDSSLILAISDVFMLLGAVSFALHFRIWSHFTPSMYLKDEETRTFLVLVLLLSLTITVALFAQGVYASPLESLSQSVFHLISFITSTGFGAGNFTEWPNAVVLLLVFASYLGGCAGSTAGGNKIIRNILVVKLVNLEMKKLLHPSGVFVAKFRGKPVQRDVINATFAFMCLAAGSSLIFTFVLMTTGLDFWSSFTAVAACINVLGPAFGELGSNFTPVNDVGTWVLSMAMLVGRLEYFTVLALLLPSFWRR